MTRSAHREAVGPSSRRSAPSRICRRQRDTRAGHRSPACPALGALAVWQLAYILALLREAETLAEALDDPRRLARVSLVLFEISASWVRMTRPAPPPSAPWCSPPPVGMVRQAQANQRLGVACQAQGDYRRAIDCFRQSLAV